MVKKNLSKVEIPDFNEIIHKEGKIIKLKFLSNDVDVNEWSNPNDLSEKPKVKTKYIFDVLNMDTNQEKLYGIISNPLMKDLQQYEPLKDKEFTIRKYRFGSELFDIEYEVIHLNP